MNSRFPTSLTWLSLPPILANILLWLLADSSISLLSLTVSSSLLTAAWISFRNWVPGRENVFPLICGICGIYWLYFAVPLFLGSDTILMYQFMDVQLSDSSLQVALHLVGFGILCTWLGMRSRLGRALVPRFYLDFVETSFAWDWTRIILFFGILLNTVESAPLLLGSGLRQLIVILQATVPLAAFAILLRRWFQGYASRLDKALVVAFLLVRLMVGIASGWLGSVVGILVVTGVVYLNWRRRLPIGLMVSLVVVFLFLQAGKEDFRRTYWRSSVEAGKVDRVAAWVSTSWRVWGDSFSDSSGEMLRERLLRVMGRVSLLPQTANVLEMTPRVVPFQGLHLYSYIGVTLIPRFVWRNKPSINEANQFYQVAYGLTTEENLSTVSISVGCLTEGYIAWGWTGVALVMFLMGVFYDFFGSAFLSNQRGDLFRAIGVCLLFHLMAIESQLSQYLGGMLQQILVTILVFLPVLRVRYAPRIQSGDMPTRKSSRIPAAYGASLGRPSIQT